MFRQGRRGFVFAFLAAPVLLYTVYVVSPYLQAFRIAVTDWHGVSTEPRFVGLANFARLLGDETFWTALAHNGVLLVVVPVVTIAIGLLFAHLLTSGGRGSGVAGSRFYRVVLFLPQVLAVAVVAVLFQSVLKPGRGGLVNGPLTALGLTPVGFLTDPRLALWTVAGVLVWQSTGFYVVLFSAAMASIPPELYEAARLDGASGPRLFFRVTLPLIWDSIQVAWVYLGIAAFDAFTLVWVLTADHGGPDRATIVLATEVYRNAFVYSKFGYASALGVALFFLTTTFAVLVLRFTRREDTEYRGGA
ncbi:sugar ABC transporter permease [Amycolatopsis sp. NPDC004169]|uniref:carbohydrate ABC transporter permease n=1 Tax=Amycolatopsis sp. NPDC004169 TaxID=3154453 RepID=UPI0033B166C8